MKMLFFSPHAAIWEHAFPEAIIASSLKSAENEIIYVSCGGEFEGICVAKSGCGITSNSSSSQANKVCIQCNSNADFITKKFDFTHISIKDVLEKSDRDEIDRLLSSLDLSRPDLILFDGLEIGKFALYQLTIRFKLQSQNLTGEARSQYASELKNAYLSAFAIKKLITKYQPDRIFVNNGMYSVNRIVYKIGEASGIPVYFNSSGNNLYKRFQKVMLGRGDYFRYFTKIIPFWMTASKIPSSGSDIERVVKHYLELLQAKNIFVYSSPKSSKKIDIRKQFDIDSEQKILVATLSSHDEESAVQMVGAREDIPETLFKNQEEWINFLIDYIKGKPNYFLIIRPHPREFPNRRDGVLSDHALVLLKLEKNLPKNVVFDFPKNNISIYEYLDEADIFLNAWSSAGKEMALYGKPVVIYSKDLIMYPSDLNYLGDTLEEYVNKIELAIHDGWSFDRVVRAFRWGRLEFIDTTIDISERCKIQEAVKRGLLIRGAQKILNYIWPNLRKIYDLRAINSDMPSEQKIQRLIESGAESVLEIECINKNQGDDAVRSEAALVARAYRRLLVALFPSEDDLLSSRLYLNLKMVEKDVCI